MADVSGPVSTLPGACSSTPEGTMCDDHPERPAVGRIQGETDSFGAEYLDLCAECMTEFAKHRNDARVGVCDWCKQEATTLRHHRDYEEGMYGRVYDVCQACRRKEMDELNAEMQDNDYSYHDSDDET